MNLKNFEYLNKDVTFLRKDLVFRASFTVAFFAIFAYDIGCKRRRYVCLNRN